MENHKLLDSYKQFTKGKKDNHSASDINPLAHMMVIVLKNKSYQLACKSYSNQRAFWVALSNLLCELRSHNLAVEMSHLRKELMISSLDEEYQSLVPHIRSLRGNAHNLVTLFHNGEYSHVYFRNIWEMTERYFLKMKKEQNLPPTNL